MAEVDTCVPSLHVLGLVHRLSVYVSVCSFLHCMVPAGAALGFVPSWAFTP